MKSARISLQLLMICILLIPLSLNAQYRSELPDKPDPGLVSSSSGSVLGFLDPSRLQIQNSYSMMISSSGRHTQSLGILQSTFDYYINPQLRVRGRVGLLHDPLSNMVGPANEQTAFLRSISSGNLILGGEILYRPTENMLLQFGFNQQPSTRSLLVRPQPYRGPR